MVIPIESTKAVMRVTLTLLQMLGHGLVLVPTTFFVSGKTMYGFINTPSRWHQRPSSALDQVLTRLTRICVFGFSPSAGLLRTDTSLDAPSLLPSGGSEMNSLPSAHSCDHPLWIRQRRIKGGLGVHDVFLGRLMAQCRFREFFDGCALKSSFERGNRFVLGFVNLGTILHQTRDEDYRVEVCD